MTVIPWGPWKPDVSDYNGQHTQRAENVFPRGDGYGPVPDLAALTTALPAACRGAFLALNTDGTISVFAGTATDLYKLNNTDLSWENVSNPDSGVLLEDGSSLLLLESGDNLLLESSGDPYAVPAANQWQFAQLGSVVVAVNGANNPQAYTLGTSANFADLGGSPPIASYVTVINEFIVLSGLTANPFRIQWSARSSATGWTSGTNESDFQDFTDGGVVRGVAGGEFGVVFQDNAMRNMIYQPGSAVIFSFDRIAEGKGLSAPYSLVKAGERIFFKSATGFEMMVPGGQPTPIGRERFDRTIDAELDTGAVNLIIGAYEPDSSRIYWSFKSTTGTAGLFNRILVWDFVLERGALITGISGEYMTALAAPALTLEGLDASFPSIDAMSVSLDDIPSNFSTQLTLFASDHTAGFLSGSYLEATLETAETAGDRRTLVNAVRPDTDAGTVYSALLTRTRLADIASTSSEVAMDSLGFAFHRIDARLIKYRNRIPAATQWSFSIGVEPMDPKTTGWR